ncbi:unnamed protein product [Closterium sp. NIES-65]|nr:unnamed protein product [Closterium sp. NIES-65]
MTKAPFPTGNEKRSSRPLELVHSDIMDLGDAHPSLRYVLTLKDDFTNYLWVAPLVRRSDMQAVFTAWHREMKTKLPTKPLATLRTDNGGEYTANAFTEYLSSHGVIHETSLPHTPQQNGVAERVNRTLMDKVRTMTTGASLSSTFWPYALEYATWLHNRISCSSNPSAHSPYYVMTGKPADVSMARTFGCLCYYLPPQGSFGKFEQRGRAGMFLGISNVRKAWIVRDMASDVDTDTRSARFFDDLMLPDAESLLERQRYVDEVSPHVAEWTSGGEEIEHEFDPFPSSPSSSASSTDMPTGHQVCSTPAGGMDKDSPAADAADSSGAATNDIPAAGVSISENGDDHGMENETCHLYDFAYPPEGIPLTEQGAPQRRVHFDPTVTVLGEEGQAAHRITGLDVLLGKRQAGQVMWTKEDMPQGVNSLPSLQQHVLGCAAATVPMVDLTYKEPKSLKELTTDPYAPFWQAAVNAELTKFDELGAYEVVDRADVPKGVPVFTEGIIFRSNDEEGIQAVIQHLKDNFTLTVNSTMTQFLGLNVTTSRNTISLGLTKYIKQALANYGMEECRSGVRTPISKEPGPQGESPEEVDNQRVMQQVGALLYVSTAGRPDITFATHVLARQASKPTAATVLGIRRVFKYLQNTAEIGLVYGEGDLVLRGYTDSDYANEVGCHSVGGYVFTMGGAAVSWRTKRQTVIATSTTEAEYIAMFEGAREAAHLRRLCADLGFPQREPTVLYVDNQSAIALGKGEQMSQRTKHMEVRYHWTRKAVRDGVVWLEYCPTTKQAADYLTKPVTSKQHLTCSVLSGLQPIPPGVPSGDIRHVKNADVVLTCAASSSGATPHGVT